MSDNEEILALRTRVFASEACMWLQEMDCRLGLPPDAGRAFTLRMEKALWSKEDLLHALRGEGLTIEEAEEISRADAARYDALLEEDERRETAARKQRNTDLEEAA